jgi:hypothetical protein
MSVVILLRNLTPLSKKIATITSSNDKQFILLPQMITTICPDVLGENNQGCHWTIINISSVDPINSLRMLFVQKKAFNCTNRIYGISVILLK